ncbi:histidine triad nucleotide-binding protein [Candidatus Azambacteria bacterium RIFOXYD1_FULL_42_11]|uniref:Histidine triad (HIT) protein n=4 Tax=Candidatus Azamiibacteriota TaxID=1752741 RepID=A0A0G0ZCJ9_9BACT|nr:MAG: Histidine triad (HIT) protein [Candidatus Azambacteria bacterium GW2011_GWB1_42_17]KKS46394.1 MAG: Histidine triad (HIT) protein [Candidatus Azambacteria bacterium GW2011_GWA1_42_19]KKS76001.1 MAG: Histidine triad (HIT) protein [Candidatus Azambacteria bacterium GW2011_GWA2_42_9]KKS88764.1 MAG: Histidine triad (HIT) protein [Parcubacteria group bacterium GW2011_GWC1_43_11]OGD43015.1 MAG: histidine triad nucleotide-binding protein [Candidatus Azambacteria bacterium RIFOXYD1_FULL_42_11]
MNNCIFCKIVSHEIPSDIVLEDEKFLIFKDIRPKAQIHLLIIPKKHLGPVNILTAEDKEVVGEMILKARGIAEKIGVSQSGYRLIFNVGKDAGMEVDHLHLHLLAGKSMPF